VTGVVQLSIRHRYIDSVYLLSTTAGAILTGVGMNGSGDTNAFVAVFDPTGAICLFNALGDTLQSVGSKTDLPGPSYEWDGCAT